MARFFLRACFLHNYWDTTGSNIGCAKSSSGRLRNVGGGIRIDYTGRHRRVKRPFLEFCGSHPPLKSLPRELTKRRIKLHWHAIGS